MVFDEEGARYIAQLLAGIVTYVPESAATWAGQISRIVTDDGTWQICRQRLAFGLAALRRLIAGGRTAQHGLDGGQILVDGLLEQQPLDTGQFLALVAEAK